jgi:hypothetical protein
MTRPTSELTPVMSIADATDGQYATNSSTIDAGLGRR